MADARKMDEPEIGKEELYHNEHQAAYIFKPDSNLAEEPSARPSKRRKLTRRDPRPQPDAGVPTAHRANQANFIPLFNGAESARCASIRERLYARSWAQIDDRIQNVLKGANQTTLDEVGAFVEDAATQTSKIPAAFIITGPNTTSQDLLFEQLSGSLRDGAGAADKYVRIRSAEASNLKATLKKIIRDVTIRATDEGGAGEEAELSERKYLDYDLEALHHFLKSQESQRVIIAFQDSEAFDSGLLSELIVLFSSWQNRIKFTLLFGIATSVALFQARLLKSTAQHLYGALFGVIQSASVLDAIMKQAVASADVSLRIGPTLLRTLVERQQEHVAGLQAFTSSLKYAHMCYFYANPLSILLAEPDELVDSLQQEHFEAVRTLPSFRRRVETAVDSGHLEEARGLLNSDDFLMKYVEQAREHTTAWALRLERTLSILGEADVMKEDFAELYTRALSEGIEISDSESPVVVAIRGMLPDELLKLVIHISSFLQQDDASTGTESREAVDALSTIRRDITALRDRAEEDGRPLRSKYGAQSKIVRTTVVAQKVQLSQDTAKLSDDDRVFTEQVDKLVGVLRILLACEPAEQLFLHEVWLYDSKLPYRDVFVPRPSAAFDRALSRPHDYLECACCAKVKDGLTAAFPTTSILYHLYLETGSLVNVADLWSAFYALVGDGEDGESSPAGLDERTALVLFYRALAELKAMGFVKGSRKKADHIAKVKWL